jgi:hypothetical protein
MHYFNIAPRVINLKLTTLVASSLMFIGCAVPLTREERIGPDDGSDICRPNVVALDSTGNFFAEDMLKGAATGAATGALTGGFLALLSGKSGEDIAKSALVGGAVGGIAGAIGGYYKSRMEQGRDQGILAINNDLTRESSELDKADIAVRALITCRVKQRDRIRADYAARRISKGEAQQRWNLLQEQVRRDNNLMQMVAENIGKRQEEYKYASDQVAAEFDISKLTLAEQRAARKRIDANNKRIDREYAQEVAKIDRDAAKTRKTSANKKSMTEIDQEKRNRKIAAQKARDTKKEVNQKTGGEPNAVQLASKFSSTQNKADTTAKTAKNYQAEVAVEDNGFEKTEARLWQNLPGFVYAIDNQGIPINIDISWIYYFSSISLNPSMAKNSWLTRV